MREWQSLSHVKWECKYHVVIVPKYRKRVLYGCVKRDVGEIGTLPVLIVNELLDNSLLIL